MAKPLVIKTSSILELNVRYENDLGIKTVVLQFENNEIPAVLGAEVTLKVVEIRHETVEKL